MLSCRVMAIMSPSAAYTSCALAAICVFAHQYHVHLYAVEPLLEVIVEELGNPPPLGLLG